jgi:hypothetical protein
MKKFAITAAALLALGTGPTIAQTPQPADWVTLKFSAEIAKPADEAWKKVGGNDWCGIAKYLAVKGCTINKGKGELGSLRTIITATGSVVENVVARTSRSYTYAQPFTPIFYHGTMAIEPVGANRSRLTYELIWNQAALPDQKARTEAYEGRKVRFQAAVDKMKAAAEAP